MSSRVRESTGSILIVDDDPFVLDASSGLLREYGYEVVACSEARDAISILEESPFDVVLTDIVMPCMNGIELLAAVHAIVPDTPVILMTAYADIEKAVDAVRLGAFDFLVKPYEPALLRSAVERAFRFARVVRMEREYRRMLEEFNAKVETLVAERMMGLMALTVADRIRNPATVIGLTCKKVLERKGIPEKEKADIERMLGEAEKLEKIVRDFRSILSRRQSMFSVEDLSVIIGDAMSLVANDALQKGIAVDLRLPERPLRINVQRHLIQAALAHLIRNAVEATSQNGGVAVSACEEDDRAVVVISDTGQGIRGEDMGRIFDPLFSTREQRYGMGLALVRQIISEHFGEIHVSSGIRKGTVFTITFPLRWQIAASVPSQ